MTMTCSGKAESEGRFSRGVNKRRVQDLADPREELGKASTASGRRARHPQMPYRATSSFA